MRKAKESRFRHKRIWVERSALVLDVVKFVIIHEESGSTNSTVQLQR
jgi:hypothetical protein